jgi:hypothetical protein
MYTLKVITRGERAERPSEAVILSDSIKMTQGVQPSQDPTKDNFFIIKGDAAKNTIRMERQYNGSPYLPQENDGVADYPYPHSGKMTRATELRTWEGVDEEENPITVSSKAHVQHLGGTEIYDTLEEARTFIETLDASEGYTLIDEGKDTQVIEARPTLIPSEEEKPFDVDISVKNIHRRTEADRY